MPPPLIIGATLVLITVSMLVVPSERVRPVMASADAEQVAEYLAWEARTLLNQERVAAGLHPLDEAPDLDSVAVTRALEMASSGTLSHYGPSGSSAEAILRSQGMAYARVGENIARSNQSAESVVPVVHFALMASEQHRANMLDPWFEQVGIGVARIGDTYYFSVVFIGD